MRDILKSKIWQLFLAIAFLSMQSASAHIHLGSNHDHDGHDHTHSQLIHTNSISSHHVDAFAAEIAPHTSEVVELCQDWTVKNGKKLNDHDSQAYLSSDYVYREQTIVVEDYRGDAPVPVIFRFYFSSQARAPPI
ncbi:hypothetical protein [Oleiphilus sp. HI0067]|uniref:hypothetical protein n=1 Tax=Oleiphilus sp. HI0067 TaxID=1822243 RepID=UPI0007C2C834|nr:hypothetical protein [Oleiphilus sp. HI0067]KZY61301.1 hypothetical protein A3738_14150 [Oleiphilus sp. HI0066]KZY70723.1 hypothetical protein A3738_24380 [Oleiphilus sp. HI0066]KZY72840.1 hypothetical protein A3739_15545 [Oleiphilus sp. HI0067]